MSNVFVNACEAVRGRASKFYVKFVQKEPFWCPLTAGTISSFSKWHWEIGTITTRSGFVRLELGIQENSNLKKRMWHLAVIIVCDKSIYRRMCGSISIVAEWKSWSSGDEIPPKTFYIFLFIFLFFFVEEEEEEVSTDRQHHLLYLYIRKKNKTTNVIGKVSTI